jgi:hypothetical protein
MSLEFLDIGVVKDGDEISVVQFECMACGHCLDIVRIEKTEAIDSTRTARICETKCSCGKHSGFNFFSVGEGQSATDAAKRSERQEDLCAALAENLRHPTIKTRRIIQFLMTGRNLRLRFGIERGPRR